MSKVGFKVAILYATLWFIDLLDVTVLNIALPHITDDFGVDPTQGEWAILGFITAFGLSFLISPFFAARIGKRRIFLLAQTIYILSTVACGLTHTIDALIAYRIVQGLSGGMLLPVGGEILFNCLSEKKRKIYSGHINTVLLLAFSVGPLFASHITHFIGWRWLFFFKAPISIVCLIGSFYWICKFDEADRRPFEWLGCLLLICAVLSFLIALSAFGAAGMHPSLAVSHFIFSALSFAGFILVEKHVSRPLFPLSIFQNPLFVYGNGVQMSVNLILLGAGFLIALFLQRGIGLDILRTGFILAAISPGMLVAHLFKLPRIFSICAGLLLLSFCMILFALADEKTHQVLLFLYIFLEGFASRLVLNANRVCFYVSNLQKSIAATISASLKQLSSAIGVAATTMIITVGLSFSGFAKIPPAPTPEVILSFHIAFWILAAIPLIALIFCYKIYKHEENHYTLSQSAKRSDYFEL